MPSQYKITVLKKELDEKLAAEYCQIEITSCPIFKEGQEFITGFEKPEGFCDWAWNDILRFVVVLHAGGNFSKDNFEGFQKSMIFDAVGNVISSAPNILCSMASKTYGFRMMDERR